MKEESKQKRNQWTQTKVDTAYHGVTFLGKVSYPYGYQKTSKRVAIRVCQRAKEIQYVDDESLIAKVNSQVGILKNYNCKKLIRNYANTLPKEVQEKLIFNENTSKFKKR